MTTALRLGGNLGTALVALCVWLCGACTRTPAPGAPTVIASSPPLKHTAPPPASAEAIPPSNKAPPAAPLPPALMAAPEWEHYLHAEQVEGALLLWEPSQGAIRCAGQALCTERFLPASTFKIPNSLIGLETGVVADAYSMLLWDGQKRSVDVWNRDHDLRTAFHYSVVWYYREVARSVGEERMQAWLNRFEYGNRNIGGGIDLFWLDGDLRISPVEQAQFLERVASGSLPVSHSSRDTLLDIMTLAHGDGWTLRAKTGTYQPEEQPRDPSHPSVAWLVGWMTQQTRYTVFVILIVERRPDFPWDALREQRVRVTETFLRGEGVMPKDAPPLAKTLPR